MEVDIEENRCCLTLQITMTVLRLAV